MTDVMTHFAQDNASSHTLCGQRWRGIVMNDRPATCRVCQDEHHAKGWTFPLPTVVVA